MRSALPATVALAFLLAGCESGAPPATDTAEAPAPAATSTPPAQTVSPLTPLFGAWAIDAAHCESPIRIAEASFEGRENVCTITGWASGDDDRHTATLTCTGEGQTATEQIAMTPIFGPQGEGIRLDYVDRGGAPVTVFRCPTPRAP